MTPTELPDTATLLEREHTVAEVALSFRRSTRWLKDRMKRELIEHTRHGDKITFTDAQVEALRARDRVVPVAKPITTGPAK